MDKLLFRRILMIALSVLAVVYAAYLLISTNFKMYPTENAVQTTVTDKIYSNGFIIRDENMIQNNTSGVLSYTHLSSSKRSVPDKSVSMKHLHVPAFPVHSLHPPRSAAYVPQKNGEVYAV